MKIYLINDTSTSSNWGCRATTNALHKMIQNYGAVITHVLPLNRMSSPERYVSERTAQWIDRVSQLIILGKEKDTNPNDYSFYQSHKKSRTRQRILKATRLVLDEFINVIDTIPVCFSEFEPFAKKVVAGEILEPERLALEECDLVVINGEGSIYDRQRKGRMMLFIAYLAKQHFGKPCILVNHTADVHDPVMAEMASQVYPLLDDVVFREPLSADACSSFLQGRNSTLGADAAFTYRPVTDPAWSSIAAREGYFSIWPDSALGFDPRQPYICIGGSSIYLRPDRPAYDPIPGFMKLCKILQEQVAPVVLTAPAHTDWKIFHPIAESLHLPLITVSTPTQQAVDILGNARAYVSGRWHPSIMALTGGTPIVTLTANTYKTQSLINQIGLDAPTFDALKLHEEIEPMVELTRSYIKEGDSLRERLRQRAEELSELAWENVRYLKC